jgi:hypothetical protein
MSRHRMRFVCFAVYYMYRGKTHHAHQPARADGEDLGDGQKVWKVEQGGKAISKRLWLMPPVFKATVMTTSNYN